MVVVIVVVVLVVVEFSKNSLEKFSSGMMGTMKILSYRFSVRARAQLLNHVLDVLFFFFLSALF